ncbi:MAG: Gfo/Idh/MocA family oxidoreductase [Verrucomicrobia bacterium]|nr:Gfo/Idh/MocA family oxidoreductase [Verrucomicrobiota bacterium]
MARTSLVTSAATGSGVVLKRREFLQCSAGFAASALLARAATAPSASPSPMKAVVIGHTGRGNFGHNLDAIFDGVPGVELAALADADAAGRAKAQQRTKVPRAYADYREMLEKERPQLVSVAPRWTDQHFAMVKAALEAGAHVYCEKPFTRTLAEADELLAFAAKRGLKIAVAHQGRVAPSILLLKRQLDEGAIGELLEIRVHGKQDKRAGGEDLLVLGTHQFDQVRLFAGDALWCSARILQGGREVTRTDARAATEDIGPIVGDEVEAMFAMTKGVNVRYTSRAKSAAMLGPWGMELIGAKGSVRILSEVYPQVLWPTSSGVTMDGEARTWRPRAGEPSATATAADRVFPACNRRVVDDWLAAIRENREPLCSGLAAMKSLEMIHAVFAAGISRGRVELPLKNRQHPLA